MDPDYLEYNAEANVDDGSCAELVVFGCTDPTACNYSGGYNTDDGSCIYAEQVYGSDLVDCFGNCYKRCRRRWSLRRRRVGRMHR